MYFFDNLKKYSERNAIITEHGERISYKELLNEISRVEKYITNKRTRVFLISDNNYEFIISYYALLKKRSIVFLLNSKITYQKLEQLTNIYFPEMIFDCSENLERNIKKYFIHQNLKKLKILKAMKKVRCKSDIELAQLISTSGSTGSPKFVKQSYKNIEINTKDIVDALKLNKNDITLTTMDPSYSYGLTKINSHIYVGGSIVLNKKTVFEKDFWNKIENFGVTNFGGVPFFFEMLKKLKFHSLNLSSVKHISQAGGKLNIEVLKYLKKELKKLKIKFYVMYGQTEAGPRITVLDHKYFNTNYESVGKPIGKIKLWIQNKENKIKEPNTIGELYCKGKNVMLGYASKLNDLKKKRSSYEIKTGDLAYIDKKGFVYIKGRSKRIVKPFGIRVDLSELENFLDEYNFKNCICIGDDKKINIYSKYESESEKIKDLIFKKLKIKKNIFYFLKIERTPRDANGKILFKL